MINELGDLLNGLLDLYGVSVYCFRRCDGVLSNHPEHVVLVLLQAIHTVGQLLVLILRLDLGNMLECLTSKVLASAGCSGQNRYNLKVKESDIQLVSFA